MTSTQGNGLTRGQIAAVVATILGLVLFLCCGAWWAGEQSSARFQSRQDELHGRANVLLERWPESGMTHSASSYDIQMDVMTAGLRDLYGSNRVRFLVLVQAGDGTFEPVAGALANRNEQWVRSHESAAEWGSMADDYPLVGWRSDRLGASGTRVIVDGEERRILLGWVLPGEDDE